MHHRPNRKIFKRLRLTFWIFEVVECLLSIAILGVTGSAASGMQNDLDFASIPSKLAYNIAIATITMTALLVMIPLDLLRPVFWGQLNKVKAPWPRVVLNAVFSILWIGGIASSVYNCSDLCTASGFQYDFVRYATLCCNCFEPSSTACFSPNEIIDHVEQRSYRYEVTEALDAIMLLLLLVSTFVLAALDWVKEAPLEIRPGLELKDVQGTEHQPQPPEYKAAVADVTNW